MFVKVLCQLKSLIITRCFDFDGGSVYNLFYYLVFGSTDENCRLAGLEVTQSKLAKYSWGIQFQRNSYQYILPKYSQGSGDCCREIGLNYSTSAQNR